MAFSETYPDETAADRAEELVIAERFRAETGARRLDQLSQGSRVDYLAWWPGNRRAWLEVRRCGRSLVDFRSFFFPVGKWSAGIEWAQTTGSRFIIAVAFTDGDRAYVYNPADVTDHVIEPLAWNGLPSVAIPLNRMRSFASVGKLYPQRVFEQPEPAARTE